MHYKVNASISLRAETTPVQVRMSESLLRLVEKYRKDRLRTSRSDAIKFLILDYGNKLAEIRELKAEIERLKTRGAPRV